MRSNQEYAYTTFQMGVKPEVWEVEILLIKEKAVRTASPHNLLGTWANKRKERAISITCLYFHSIIPFCCGY